MYKKDYHPDNNLIFETKNYGFSSPKSTTLEPLSNALVQIDDALKKEETERIADIARESADRINADNVLEAKSMILSSLKIQSGYEGESTNVLPVYQCGRECYALTYARVRPSAKYFYIFVPVNTTSIEISDAYMPQVAGKATYRYTFVEEPTLNTDDFLCFRSHDRFSAFVTTGSGTAIIVHFTTL